MKREIKSLTGLRGIAAVMVMLYHFNLSKLLTGNLATIMGHGYLMVDLFFVLSGFVVSLTYGSWFQDSTNVRDIIRYSIRRFARIYPLYAVMTVTAAILVATGWMDRWSGPAVQVSMIVNFTMLQTLVEVPSLDTPGWSVSAEWIASLLFPFLAFALLRRSWGIVVLIGVISMIAFPLMIGAPALIEEPKRAGLMDIWHYGTIYPVLRAIAGFIIGIILFRLYTLNWVKRIVSHKLYCLLILIALIVSMSFKDADLISVYLIPFLVLGLIPDNDIVAKVLGSKIVYRLGVLSYSIYLIHNQLNYFILELTSVMRKLSMNYELSLTLSITLFSLLTILLAEITYRTIELPARNYIRKLENLKN